MKDERRLLNQTELAKFFGVHTSRIQALASQGRIELVKKIGPSCMYYLDEVEEVLNGSFVTAHRSKIQARLNKNPKNKKKSKIKTGETFQDSKTRNEKLKADLKQLELDKKNGLVIDKEEAVNEWITHISAAKIQMLGITSKIKPLLNSIIQDPEDIKKLLKDIDSLINQALTELSGEDE